MSGRHLSSLYKHKLGLLTDLYQLTMACGYFREGLREAEGVFHLSFRREPFRGGYALACGLASAVELFEGFGFDDEDVAYLAGLKGADDRPLFQKDFLEHLRGMRFTCDVDAMEEGQVAFAHEPLLRIRGPLIQCQLLETPLLNCLNFETLIATKAARICLAARGEPVLEFGLRRAQGVDGAVSASRAAVVGGCDSTSNVLAGKLFGLPVKGTHAHSWIMCFEDELEAFRAYARAMPNNCIFLVDTYDTLEGVRHAAQVGRELAAEGHRLLGVRLDSGDLAYLSKEARRILDEAGFPEAQIVASNDLDETIITSLKQQGAAIGVWGVGTKLATAYDQPALGGVYKLSALRRPGQDWRHTLKLSEQAIKISTPGCLQVRRFHDGREPKGDLIFDEFQQAPLEKACVMVDPLDDTRQKKMDCVLESEDLLKPIFRAGRRVYEPPTALQAREKARHELDRFHGGVKRLVNPHDYPVGLEESLYHLKRRLIREARGLT